MHDNCSECSDRSPKSWLCWFSLIHNFANVLKRLARCRTAGLTGGLAGGLADRLVTPTRAARARNARARARARQGVYGRNGSYRLTGARGSIGGRRGPLGRRRVVAPGAGRLGILGDAAPADRAAASRWAWATRPANAALVGESITTARDLACLAREQRQRGADPIDERDQCRDAGRQAEQAKKAESGTRTFTLAFRAARDHFTSVIEPRLTDKHAAQWIASLEKPHPTELWHAPIASIEARRHCWRRFQGASARARAQPGGRSPGTLRRIRQRLDTIFEDAIFHGHLQHRTRPRLSARKMRETMPRKESGKFAALAYREAPALMQRLREAGTAARCLEFAVLTAARTGEVLGAVWSASSTSMPACGWCRPRG